MDNRIKDNGLNTNGFDMFTNTEINDNNACQVETCKSVERIIGGLI